MDALEGWSSQPFSLCRASRLTHSLTHLVTHDNLCSPFCCPPPLIICIHPLLSAFPLWCFDRSCGYSLKRERTTNHSTKRSYERHCIEKGGLSPSKIQVANSKRLERRGSFQLESARHPKSSETKEPRCQQNTMKAFHLLCTHWKRKAHTKLTVKPCEQNADIIEQDLQHV